MGLIFIKFNPYSPSFQVAPLAYLYKIWLSAPPSWACNHGSKALHAHLAYVKEGSDDFTYLVRIYIYDARIIK